MQYPLLFLWWTISSGYIEEESTMIAQDKLLEMMSVIPEGDSAAVGNHDGYMIEKDGTMCNTRDQIYELL